MNRHVDKRSDIYSFGVVCYQMLTGRLPFESENALEIVHSHIAREPMPPPKVRAEGGRDVVPEFAPAKPD